MIVAQESNPVKRFSSPDNASGRPLRSMMFLLFLTASLTILAVTLFHLWLFTNPDVLSLLSSSLGGMQTSPPSRPLLAIALLVDLLGIAIIAWLSFAITASINNIQKTGAAFARAIYGGKFDKRLPSPEKPEINNLYSALNDMADRLQQRLSAINDICESLATIDTQLEKNTRQVTQSVRQHQTAATQVTLAMDNIRVSVNSMADDIDLLERAAESIVSASRELEANIRRMESTSETLETARNEVSASTAELSASIRETGSSIVTLLTDSGATAPSSALLDSSTRQTEKNALEAATISERAGAEAKEGRQAIEEIITGMHAMQGVSATIANAMGKLTEKVDEVCVLLSVIDEFTEQTDLLALNATIMAAQAGDSGAQFAMISGEIRELSERISCTSSEISTAIQGARAESGRTVAAINQAEEHIVAGLALSLGCAATLERLSEGSRQVVAEFHSIASNSVEQAHAVQIIKESMQRVGKLARRIADSSAGQIHAGAMISASMERMKIQGGQLRISTGEGYAALNRIIRANKKTLETISRLHGTRDIQIRNTTTALDAIREPVHSAGADTLEHTLAKLRKQTVLLEKQVSP